MNYILLKNNLPKACYKQPRYILHQDFIFQNLHLYRYLSLFRSLLIFFWKLHFFKWNYINVLTSRDLMKFYCESFYVQKILYKVTSTWQFYIYLSFHNSSLLKVCMKIVRMKLLGGRLWETDICRNCLLVFINNNYANWSPD